MGDINCLVADGEGEHAELRMLHHRANLHLFKKEYVAAEECARDGLQDCKRWGKHKGTTPHNTHSSHQHSVALHHTYQHNTVNSAPKSCSVCDSMPADGGCTIAFARVRPNT